MKKLTAILSIVYLFTCNSSFAAGHEVVVGKGTAHANSIIPSASGGDHIEFTPSLGGCYCCEVWSTDTTNDKARFNQLIFSSLVEGSMETPVSSVAAGEFEPKMPYILGSLLVRGSNRACFQVPTDFPTSTVALSFAFGDDGNAAASNVRVMCEETTLYGGFNTSVTDFNFLELRNTGGATKVNVKIRNAISGETKYLNDVEVTGRRDLDIHSVVGDGAYGSVSICSDGPKGAIKAQMGQYNITSTNPLNFEPVAREVFETRD